MNRGDARVLVVGVGGIGCPAVLALARSGVGAIGLCDDDVVDRSNLHRQILFADGDVGAPKVAVAAARLEALAPAMQVREHPQRLLPENAVEIVRQYDVVLEGSDNFATKFMAADACRIAGTPIVHASAVRWVGTALAVGPLGRPCYRCLFEDLPGVDAPNCAQAGVMGPVVGLVAAAQVDLALGFIDGQAVAGDLITVEGKAPALRRRPLPRRPDCALCGAGARIQRIDPSAYAAHDCA